MKLSFMGEQNLELKGFKDPQQTEHKFCKQTY